MDDREFPIDGHVLDDHLSRCAEERERYLRFIREEGVPLLALYRDIEDPAVREALRDLVKTFAFSAAGKS